MVPNLHGFQQALIPLQRENAENEISDVLYCSFQGLGNRGMIIRKNVSFKDIEFDVDLLPVSRLTNYPNRKVS